MIGSLIGPYEIIRGIGQGCMGVVYLGRHRVLEVEHAIKVLPYDFSQDPTRIQRFLKEARQSARLSHPNIVRVVGADVSDGLYYIAMEYIDTNDTAKLTDFGLARELDHYHTSQSAALTDAGTPIGTPFFMSPEQWRNEGVDNHTDIYALGVFFYHLLTGAYPYPGQTIAQVLYNQARGALTPLRHHLPQSDDILAWWQANLPFYKLDLIPTFMASDSFRRVKTQPRAPLPSGLHRAIPTMGPRRRPRRVPATARR